MQKISTFIFLSISSLYECNCTNRRISQKNNIYKNFEVCFLNEVRKKGRDRAVYNFFLSGRYHNTMILKNLIKNKIITANYSIKDSCVRKEWSCFLKDHFCKINKLNHFKIDNRCNIKKHKRAQKKSLMIRFFTPNIQLFHFDCKGVYFKEYLKLKPLTILSIACYFCSYSTVEILLTNGVIIDFNDQSPYSELIYIRCFPRLIKIAHSNYYYNKKISKKKVQRIIKYEEAIAPLYRINNPNTMNICSGYYYPRDINQLGVELESTSINELELEVRYNINCYYHDRETLLYKIFNCSKSCNYFKDRLFRLLKNPYLDISKGKQLSDNSRRTPLKLLYSNDCKDLCKKFLENSINSVNYSDLEIIAKDFSLQESYLSHCSKKRLKSTEFFLKYFNWFLIGFLRDESIIKQLPYDLSRVIYLFYFGRKNPP